MQTLSLNHSDPLVNLLGSVSVPDKLWKNSYLPYFSSILSSLIWNLSSPNQEHQNREDLKIQFESIGFIHYVLHSRSANGAPIGPFDLQLFLSFLPPLLFPLCFLLTSCTIPFQLSHSTQPAFLQSPIQFPDFYTSCQLNNINALLCKGLIE